MEHLGHGGLGLGRGGFGHADPDQSGLMAGSSLKIDVNEISLFVEIAHYPLLLSVRFKIYYIYLIKTQ